MCGATQPQKILSGSLSGRRIFLRPPEPRPSLLLSSPCGAVYVGRTKFLKVPFFWDPRKLLNPHLCVVGMTGSGKSYFVKTFITRASIVLGASSLILDWAGEYSEWVRSAGGEVLEFGTSGINLLALGGATPHERTRQVIESLELLTDLSGFPLQKNLTEEAIEQAYASKGLISGGTRRKGAGKVPTLMDVHASLLAKARKSKSQDALFAARRIRNLLLSSKNSFCSGGMRLESLLCGLVSVDLHSLPTEQLRSLAGLAIIQLVQERMRREKAEGGAPRLFVVVDEAWKIAADDKSDVVSIVREGRKYGFGIIVASQNPSDVSRSIFSNAGTAVCFRMHSQAGREFVQRSLSYSDFFEEQSHSLSVGQAIVHLAPLHPAQCPSTFILEKVDGEEPLAAYFLRGDGLDLEFEKGALSRRLLSFGLSDQQLAEALAEFERHNRSLAAGAFVALLSRFGQPRTAAISLLREMGASEHDLLALFSSLDRKKGGLAQFEGPEIGVFVPATGKTPGQSPPARPRGQKTRGK